MAFRLGARALTPVASRVTLHTMLTLDRFELLSLFALDFATVQETSTKCTWPIACDCPSSGLGVKLGSGHELAVGQLVAATVTMPMCQSGSFNKSIDFMFRLKS